MPEDTFLEDKASHERLLKFEAMRAGLELLAFYWKEHEKGAKAIESVRLMTEDMIEAEKSGEFPAAAFIVPS